MQTSLLRWSIIGLMLTAITGCQSGMQWPRWDWWRTASSKNPESSALAKSPAPQFPPLPSTSATPALASTSPSSVDPNGHSSPSSPWSNYENRSATTPATSAGNLASAYPATPYPATSFPSPESAPAADGSIAPYAPAPAPNAFVATNPGQTPYPNTPPASAYASDPPVQTGPYGPSAYQAKGYDQQNLGSYPYPQAAQPGETPPNYANSLPDYRTADARPIQPADAGRSHGFPGESSQFSPSDVGDRYSTAGGQPPGNVTTPPASGPSGLSSNPGMPPTSEMMPPYQAPAPEREAIGAGNPITAERLGVVPTQPGNSAMPSTNRIGAQQASNRFRPGGTSDYLGQPVRMASPPVSQGSAVPGGPAHQAASYQPPSNSPLSPTASVPSGSGSYQPYPSTGSGNRF